MWMCDKTPVQQELAVSLAEMTHLFSDDVQEGLRFQRTFYTTMRKYVFLYVKFLYVLIYGIFNKSSIPCTLPCASKYTHV
jgi:Nucleolar protein,Nop52